MKSRFFSVGLKTRPLSPWPRPGHVVSLAHMRSTLKHRCKTGAQSNPWEGLQGGAS